MNILFSGNDKVFDGILTCLLSIFKRTESKEAFNIYILTMDITEVKPEYIAIKDEKIRYLEKICKRYNDKNLVIKIDVTELYKKEFSGSPNEQCYCSPYTLLRLFIDLIPEIPNKILYLDADILFNRDIKLLYDTKIEGYEYAASRDHYGKYLINPNYINAGVILFNVDEIRKTGLLKKARKLIKTKKLPFADQSAIYRSTKCKKMLPQKYNDQKFLHKSTVVRHFSKRLFWLPYPHTANIKQWDVTKIHSVFRYNQFDDVLYEYIYWRERYNREKIN